MADDKKLAELKSKYQSALNKLNQLGVRLNNLHVQDGKLVLRAHAKSKADANQVWEQIKLVNPGYASELMAEITYDKDEPAAAAQAAARTYTVKKGDTLSEIAQRMYGKASDYLRIFEANRDQLDDPDKIRPGQVLKVPA